MNDRPTYPELLKLFYKHSFPDKLGDSCSSMAQAIIYKSNDLWFPASFDMSNKELSQLSGVKLTNLQRTRQKLLEGCKIDRIPLFTYVSNGTQKAGTYKINFTLGATLARDYVQKLPDSAHDPNSTLPNTTIDPPRSTGNIVTKQGPPQPEDDDKFQRVLELFQNAAPGWCIQNDIQRQKLISYCEVVEKLKPILEKAALKGVKGDSLFSWVDKGIQNYSELYEGTGLGRAGPTNAEARHEIDLLQKERVAVEAAPEKDFELRRIDRSTVLEDIDSKIERFRTLIGGQND